MKMGSEPEIDHLRNWFIAERDSGYGVDHCVKISDFVQSGKRYSEAEKVEMLSRKGTMLYNHGRDIRFSDPAKAVEVWIEALKAHLSCFYADVRSDTVRSGRADEFSRNTCFNLFDLTVQSVGREDLYRAVSEIKNFKGLYLDPLEEPLARVLLLIGGFKGTKADLQRTKGRFEAAFRHVDDTSRWLDVNGAKRISGMIDAAKASLQDSINSRAANTTRG